MRQVRIVVAVVLGALALGATGCAAKYKVIARESESPVLSGNCPVKLLEQAPETAYSILGEIKPEDPAKLADEDGAFLDAVREKVCKLTGDAVIVNRDAGGKIAGGSIIRTR